MNIRLEYSETTGQFNQASAKELPVEGFKALCCIMNSERADRFVLLMCNKFPALPDRGSKEYPPFQTLRNELLRFLEQDIQLLNEQMAKAFQRREYTFTNRS